MKSQRSLLFYLTVFAVALTLPLFALVTLATYKFSAAERERLEAQADSANQEILLLINDELSTITALLQGLSTARSLQEDDYSRFEEQARELAKLSRRHFVLYDLAGQQLVNTRVAYGTPLPHTADPEIATATKAHQEVYVSNLFTGAITKQPTLQVAVPIRRNGEKIGILSSTFFPERLVELLRQGLPEGPFFATILDRNGTIIARSVMPEHTIGKPLPALAEGSKGVKGTLSFVNAQGIPIFAFWRRPEISNWVVAAAVEQAALTAPLTRSLIILGGLSAVFALAALAVATWIAVKILRAKSMLVEAAEAVGAGRVIPAPTTPLGEFDRIGQALADTSRSLSEKSLELQRSNQELERRVEKRTCELKSKTALLETTLDTMTQGLIVIDASEHVPVCNAQARRLLDLPDELMDKHPSIDALLEFKESRGEFANCPLQSVQLLRPKVGDELFIYERARPNGTILQVSTVPIQGAAGFVRTYTDITEQRVHARELEIAKDAAEAANRAKGDFLANISHEMRTPLNAIIGYSELLYGNTRAPPEMRRHAERIHGAGAAHLSLVDNVLDLGKIDAGIIDIRNEPFAIDALVSDAVSLVQPAATDKNLRLDVHVNTAMSKVFGDRDRLRQILLNLLGNAIKFTAAGHVSLEVCSRETADGSAPLHFSVTDTGIGIAQSEQSELFQRFHQVDPAMDRKYGGAGLGLAISKQLVERLGGRIGLTSTLNAGSTFWFEVSVVSADGVVADSGSRAERSVQRAARILVAEDVVLNQDLARELLEVAGYSVEVVSNGREAVEAVRGRNFDVILMDLSMPEMDGLSATQQIRQAGIDSQTTAIVACTANVLPAQVVSFREAGIDAYLRKPLRRTELYRTIERLLEHTMVDDTEPADTPAEDTDAPNIWSLIQLLGPERIIVALERLNEELRNLSIDDLSDPSDQNRLARQAHAIISTACMLELTELSERCRELENACRESLNVAHALERLKPAIARALAEGERLRKDVERFAA